MARCERNYVVSFYLAEFFNAFSSLTLVRNAPRLTHPSPPSMNIALTARPPQCVAGGYAWYQAWRDGLELRFHALGLSVVGVGLGTPALLYPKP